MMTTRSADHLSTAELALYVASAELACAARRLELLAERGVELSAEDRRLAQEEALHCRNLAAFCEQRLAALGPLLVRAAAVLVAGEDAPVPDATAPIPF